MIIINFSLTFSIPPPTPTQLLDENLDAMVSLSELKEFWKKAAQESGGTVEYPSDGDLRQLFANTDLDRDGYINEEEFFALCEALFPGKE